MRQAEASSENAIQEEGGNPPGYTVPPERGLRVGTEAPHSPQAVQALQRDTPRKDPTSARPPEPPGICW